MSPKEKEVSTGKFSSGLSRFFLRYKLNRTHLKYQQAVMHRALPIILLLNLLIGLTVSRLLTDPTQLRKDGYDFVIIGGSLFNLLCIGAWKCKLIIFAHDT
jgi:hypothetical protein